MEVLLGLFILAAALVGVIWLAIWLITATPVLRWGMYTGLLYLALRVGLLPLEHLSVALGGGTEVPMLEEELRSAIGINFITSVGSGRYSDRFSINVSGSLTNNADRPIDRIYIACRAEKMSFGDSQTAGNHFSILVRPGETKGFSGQITQDLSGVIKAGYRDLQPPDRHFCRLDQVYEGDGN
jgi:hypothetical protein